MEFFDACVNEILITHEGGHYVPSNPDAFFSVMAFVNEALKEKRYSLSGKDAVCELKNRGLIGVAEVEVLLFCAHGK